jgi:hypothetical protein
MGKCLVFGFVALVVLSASVGCTTASESSSAASTPLSGRPSDAFDERTIPVCWEDDPETLNEKFEAERALVRTAVTSTWGAVDTAPLQFTGWRTCRRGEKAVRIEVKPKRAYVYAFGKRLLSGERGVTLNFIYAGTDYAEGCAKSDKIRLSCIVVDAVHEFGHVLGFSHEQNRRDRPANSGCTRDQIDAGADDFTTAAKSTLDTTYDPASIMNYCNPSYWDRNKEEYAIFDATHPWTLSPGDRAGLTFMYPPP